MTMQTTTELYIRDDGEALLVIGIDEDLCGDGDIARIRAHAANLSQRDGVTVRLDSPYEERMEVFEDGRLAYKLDGAFREAARYRHESWVAGAADPWREWAVGAEPVTRYVAPRATCGCTTCDAHREVEF